MNTEVLGLIALPLGVICLCLAALWQLNVVLTESYTLNRFSGRQLFAVVTTMMMTFSLAVYGFCPNARKKGIIFLLLVLVGAGLYGWAYWVLPFQAKP
ncbi:hypothetical protein LVJ82_11230 [Vitreoscilla massiliensis]|uniref:Uncharacterized protein n=1 Tax=Vitreoscilla massiliensis TaxID=1689272 RepID=A0ABY4DX20_9NEIS|nr:hypothetical protein [Vitreoscilla massiliensis]UOO88061.1 hypothetical protein LVJ82_11230 [Vitreoscilla massiliensis]